MNDRTDEGIEEYLAYLRENVTAFENNGFNDFANWFAILGMKNEIGILENELKERASTRAKVR